MNYRQDHPAWIYVRCASVNAATAFDRLYDLIDEAAGHVGNDCEIPNVNRMRCDVVNALKRLQIPVLRWPGGCFADTYHWRDGVDPQAQRKTIVNTNRGGVSEDNSFGTHEFMELCCQLGCEAYFSGNVGSGTVQELSDWVEYCNMGAFLPWRRCGAKTAGRNHSM